MLTDKTFCYGKIFFFFHTVVGEKKYAIVGEKKYD